MANVTVGCKTVHGVTFDLSNGKKVTLNGQNSNRIITMDGYTGECGFTEIAEELWEAVKREYGSLTQFAEGLIFCHQKPAEAQKMAKDIKSVKTGQEQLRKKEASELTED